MGGWEGSRLPVPKSTEGTEDEEGEEESGRGEEQLASQGRDREGALGPGAGMRRRVSGPNVSGRGASFGLGPRGNVEDFGRRPPCFLTIIRRVEFLRQAVAHEPARNFGPGAELDGQGPGAGAPTDTSAVGNEPSVPLAPFGQEALGKKLHHVLRLGNRRARGMREESQGMRVGDPIRGGRNALDPTSLWLTQRT